MEWLYSGLELENWGLRGLQEECLQEKRESDIVSEPLTRQKLGLGVGDFVKKE